IICRSGAGFWQQPFASNVTAVAVNCYGVHWLLDVAELRGESWRARASQPKGSVQAQTVGIAAPGVDRVVAYEALTRCPRLEGPVP
ncbi:MAG: hypothetical protein ACREP5_03010, partial [Candidatus Binatia bacterium]